jgi:hypothetical protein
VGSAASDDPADDLSSVWEQIEFDDARTREPDLAIEAFRVRRADEQAAWHEERARERARKAEAKEARRKERAEHLRAVVAANPWATAADIRLLEGLVAQSVPGETWAQLVDRLAAQDAAYQRLADRIAMAEPNQKEGVPGLSASSSGAASNSGTGTTESTTPEPRSTGDGRRP